MEDLAADFIIENNEPLELEAEISEPEHFDCSFELYAAGTTWGSISGTLSNQTDLQQALDLKADKTEVESVTGALADSIQAVDNKYDSITSGLDDSIIAIDNKYDSITGALDDKIDSINGALSDDIDALESITGGLSDSISAIDSTIGGFGDIVTYNAADFADSAQGALADTAVQPTDLASVAFSGEYSDLINTPTIPTVNDGQLKIQVNGSDLATFSANQGTDTIANISIPNAAEWGNITGTLSDQTDLQNALDAKVTNNATGTKALAVGDTSQSTAEGGVAVGYGARANSTYATAIGEEARANNTNTTVIGKAAKATEARAIAIGSGAEANAQDAIAIKGINNTANTFQVYTYNLLDMSTGLIPDARISSNIARTVDIPSLTNYVTTNTAQTISQTKAFSQPLVIADNNGLASGTILSNKKILQRSSGDNTLTLNNKDNKLRLVGSETRPKYSTDGSTYGDLALYSDVSAISDLIPSAATVSNQLADKNFVNSSIATNTANFIGTFNSVADLEAYSGTLTNNDYAFVVGTDSEGNTVYDRYKYTDATTPPSWIFEYELNNSSFTAAQWDAINSGITSGDVALIATALQSGDNVSALVNDAGYITSSSIPTDYYTKSEIDAILPQPTKVPIVYYQPTDSYCYTESNNRFYGSHVFEKLYLVQPKTSGTTQVIDMSTTFSLSFTIDYQKAPSSAITVAEIIASYSVGKGVLLQLNSTGLYYRNNITGTTITGTRALTAGNSYDVKAEYDGTHMIISYKLSSDANYTQINSTTCTCDGSNYNYAAIGMNADNGNMSLSSVVLTNGADTLYSYTAGKIALDYDGSTLKLNASNQLSVDFTGYATETWVGNQGFITSAALANYLQKDVAQSTTGTITFVGQKKIEFKQSAAADKLGFTLYNSSNTELGAFEYRPNTISGKALLNVNCPYTGDYVGFRYWGTAVNIVAPKPSTAGDYYIPTHITDGNTTVTANNTGSVNISSLLPTIPTVDQTYDGTSANPQSGVAIEGELANYVKNTHTGSDLTSYIDYVSDEPIMQYEDSSYIYSVSAAHDTACLYAKNKGNNNHFVAGVTPTNFALSSNGGNAFISIVNSELVVNGDTIATVSDIPTDFTGADSITAGASGLVPAPSAGDDDKILTGGGTWESANTIIGYTPADNTLSNVSSIDNGSAVKSALDDKVNKSGDIMTGDLGINKNAPALITKNTTADATSTTAPSGNVTYLDVTSRDKNDNLTGGMVLWHNTSNNFENLIYARRYIGGNEYSAYFGLKVDSSGNAHCEFPQTSCCDGQWIDSQQSMISTAPSMGYNNNALEYRIDLPNDGHIYEVMVGGRISTGSASGNFVYLTMRGNQDSYSRYCCGVRTRTNSTMLATGTVIVTASYVASGSKNLYVPRTTDYTGTLEVLNVIAYRRIGTNS